MIAVPVRWWILLGACSVLAMANASAAGPAKAEHALPEEARALFEQGKAAQDDGRYDVALEAYSRAAQIGERALGADNPALIEPWAREGLMRQQRGQIAAANALFERAISLASRHPEADGRALAAGFDAAAFAANDRGDHGAAATALEKALSLRRASRPEDAAEIALNLYRLAYTYRYAGRLGTRVGCSKRRWP